MKLSFRQGIVRYQTDSSNNPTFLLASPGGDHISLVVAPTRAIISISQANIDYLYEETASVTNAWGPFVGGTNYWLYWDIDIWTGQRTFGSTTLAPIMAFAAPSNPEIGQMWYDLSHTQMNYWSGARWMMCLRVFAAQYVSGAVINPYPVGTQVGISNGSFYAGLILFDAGGKPLRISQIDGRGQFLTTETQFYTQASAIVAFSLEAMSQFAQANGNIPAYSLISYDGPDSIIVASSDVPNNPAIGIVLTDLYETEVGSFQNSGYFTNMDWDFQFNGNSPTVYLGLGGTVTLTPPITGFIQPIGFAVNSNTIYLQISNSYIYSSSQAAEQPLQLQIDRTSGRFYIEQTGSSGTGVLTATNGYAYTHLTNAATTWNINHNGNSLNVTCQTFDINNNLITPNSFKIVDSNNVIVTWGAPQLGYARLILF